jgi:hypothetical protein
MLSHCFLSAFLQGDEEPTEISLHKGVQSAEVNLPCFLYIYSEGGPVSAGAIATIMTEFNVLLTVYLALISVK